MPENDLTQFIAKEDDIATLTQQIDSLTIAVNNANQAARDANATVHSLLDAIGSMQARLTELETDLAAVKAEVKEIRDLVFSEDIFKSLGDVQLGE